MTAIQIRSITPHFIRVSDKTVWSFVRVQSECGAVGWGEATVNGEAAAIAGLVTLQNKRLAGSQLDVTRPAAPFPQDKVGWAVLSAIDQAVWDILAQRENKPLRDLLGDSRRGEVELYANINRGTLDRSPAGFAATARAAVAAGFKAIKIAPFDDLTPGLAESARGAELIRAGLERIEAAHGAIAGHATLQVDCHWRFTPMTAEAALREAIAIGITWLECPLPETAENINEVRRLRGIANNGGVRLAGLEENATLAGFLPWVDAYDVMMPDAKYAGGLTELLRIAEGLDKRGVAVSLHNPTGAVCHGVSLHVTAALPPGLPLEIQWAESDLLFDLPRRPLPRPAGGRSVLPEGSGHGAALNVLDLMDTPP